MSYSIGDIVLTESGNLYKILKYNPNKGEYDLKFVECNSRTADRSKVGQDYYNMKFSGETCLWSESHLTPDGKLVLKVLPREE